MLKAVHALNQLRLDQDLSFRALAKAMRLAGFRVHPSTLLQLIRKPDARPHDRTLHKIEKFLASIHDAPPAKRSARRRRSATEVSAS